jgi:hypothetical protein
VGGANRVFVVGTTVLAAGATTKARGIDLETGAVRWIAETGSSPLGSGVCGNSFFVSAFQLRRYDVASGTITGQADRDTYDSFFSNVASDGQRVYAVAGRGTFAFDC